MKGPKRNAVWVAFVYGNRIYTRCGRHSACRRARGPERIKVSRGRTPRGQGEDPDIRTTRKGQGEPKAGVPPHRNDACNASNGRVRRTIALQDSRTHRCTRRSGSCPTDRRHVTTNKRFPFSVLRLPSCALRSPHCHPFGKRKTENGQRTVNLPLSFQTHRRGRILQDLRLQRAGAGGSLVPESEGTSPLSSGKNPHGREPAVGPRHGRTKWLALPASRVVPRSPRPGTDR